MKLWKQVVNETVYSLSKKQIRPSWKSVSNILSGIRRVACCKSITEMRLKRIFFDLTVACFLTTIIGPSGTMHARAALFLCTKRPAHTDNNNNRDKITDSFGTCVGRVVFTGKRVLFRDETRVCVYGQRHWQTKVTSQDRVVKRRKTTKTVERGKVGGKRVEKTNESSTA